MPIWKIIPVTPPTDARWQDRRIWREVVVRAESAAMARVVASVLDRDPARIGVGNETLKSRSGFDDEKLYWVSRAEDAADEGPPDIIRAEPLDAR